MSAHSLALSDTSPSAALPLDQTTPASTAAADAVVTANAPSEEDASATPGNNAVSPNTSYANAAASAQQQQSAAVAATYSILQNNLHALQQQQQQQQQQQLLQQGQPISSPPQQQHFTSTNKQLVENAKNAIALAAQELAQQQQQQQQYLAFSPNSSPLTGSGIDSPNDGTLSYPDPATAQRYATMASLQQQLAQQQQLLQQQQAAAQHHPQMSPQSGAHHHQHHHHHHPHTPSSPNQAFAQVLVAGLPGSFTQAELHDLFHTLPSYERCGIAMDPTTGLSIGRGWLVFSSTEHAQQAIAKMNGFLVHQGQHALHLSMMQPIGESTKSNIYVAGLPKAYTQAQLEQLFLTFGSILESKILTDPATGLSRGVAFVRYDNSNSAAQAITAVNGHVMADGVHTYTIRVKFARDHHRNADPTLAMLTGQPPANNNNGNNANSPMSPSGNSPSGIVGQRSSAIYQSYIPPHIKARGDDISQGIALFVFHIPAEFTSRDLQELFAPCATVLSARIAIHPQTLESKGFGFVSVATMEEAHQAVTLLNGRRVGRKFIKVSFKKQQAPAVAPPGVGANLGVGGLGVGGGGLNLGLNTAAGLNSMATLLQQQQAQQVQQQQTNQQLVRGQSHHQQGHHHQQVQHHQQSPTQMDTLSNLAAALNLSTFGHPQLNQSPLNLGAYGGHPQASWAGGVGSPIGGVGVPPSVVTSPASPNLLTYNQQAANAAAAASLPLHLLMQQMQLTNASFPGAAAAAGVGSPGSSIYTYSPTSLQPGATQQAQQTQQPTSTWVPPSPISLPQSALNTPAPLAANFYAQQGQSPTAGNAQLFM